MKDRFGIDWSGKQGSFFWARPELNRRMFFRHTASAVGGYFLLPSRPMEAIARADFAYFKTLTEDAITRDAGLSGHESKAWLIARAALPAGISGCAFRHYQAIDELVAGYGLMFVDGSSQQDDGLPRA